MTAATYEEKLEKLTAKDILAIDRDEPEKLFQPDLTVTKKAFKALAKKWHPDINKDPKASDVMDRITALRDQAEDKITHGKWQEPGHYTCRLKDGKTFRVRSDAKRILDVGAMHIGPTTVTFVIKKENVDLFDNALKHIGAFTFADNKMKGVYAPALPTTFKTYEAEDARILTIQKGSDDVLLRDLKPFLAGGKDLDKHIAWIMSRLHEMARYLDFAGIAHNGITLDTVFVSPENHSIALLGGWWFAAKFDEPLKSLSPEASEVISDKAFKKGMPDPKVDLELVRAVGRELLGDRGGTRLTALKTAPQPMIDYLRLPGSGQAQKDLDHWYQHVLPESFGARRFTKLPVTYSDIYKPGG